MKPFKPFNEFVLEKESIDEGNPFKKDSNKEELLKGWKHLLKTTSDNLYSQSGHFNKSARSAKSDETKWHYAAGAHYLNIANRIAALMGTDNMNKSFLKGELKSAQNAIDIEMGEAKKKLGDPVFSKKPMGPRLLISSIQNTQYELNNIFYWLKTNLGYTF